MKCTSIFSPFLKLDFIFGKYIYLLVPFSVASVIASNGCSGVDSADGEGMLWNY